jgi:cellulose biosynthesis protein BcsQ
MGQRTMKPSSAQVLCMASVKGGAGKTVLAATFGTVLAAMGKRVLLVDTDAATNGLTLLYLNEVMNHRDALDRSKSTRASGTYELPGKGERYPELVTLSENLSLLPASYKLFNSETVDVDLYAESLTHMVESWRGEFDFVFLDAQAGSDEFAHGAMRQTVSDKVILVTEYDPLSAAGVERMKALFPQDLTYDRTWVLLNKMLPDIATKYGEFLEVARYLPPVPWTAAVVRAYSRRSLALDLQYGNDYTVAVCRSLGALLDSQTAEELSDWLSQKAAELRTPIATKVRDLKVELQDLNAAEGSRLKREEQSMKFRFAVSIVGLACIVASLFALAVPLGGAVRFGALVAIGGLTLALLVGIVPTALDRADRRLTLRWPGPFGVTPARQDSRALRTRLRELESLVELDDEDLLSRGSSETTQRLT